MSPEKILLSGNNLLLAEAEANLRSALKRCSPITVEAACAFRRTSRLDQIPVIVAGVIERFVEPDLRAKLPKPFTSELRLMGDLHLDSLTLLEAVLLLEEVLQTTIESEELPRLRSLGDIQQMVRRELQGLSRASANPKILGRSPEQSVHDIPHA